MADPLERMSGEQAYQVYLEAQKRHPEFRNMDFRQFSESANRLLGTRAFDAGTAGPIGHFVQGASAGLDRLLEPISRPIGESMYSLLKPVTGEDIAQVGGKAMESFPRATAQALAMLPAAGAVTAGAPVTVPAALGALFGVGATAAEGYEKTGSPIVGAANALATAALPAAARVGTGLAARVAKPAGNALLDTLGPGVSHAVERGLEYAGANLGGIASSEVINQAGRVASGQGLQNPFTVENAAANIVGQIPFAAFDLPQLLRGHTAVRSGANVELHPAGWSDLLKPKDATTIPSITEWQRMNNAAEMVRAASDIAAASEHKSAVTATTTDDTPVVVPAKPKRVRRELPVGLSNAPTLDDAIAFAMSAGATWKDVLEVLPPEHKAAVPGVTPEDKAQFVENKIAGGLGLVEAEVPPAPPVSGNVVETKSTVSKAERERFARLQRLPKRTPIQQAEFDRLEPLMGQQVMPFDAEAKKQGPPVQEMFTEGQLQDGFGLSGQEQTNAERPFGVMKPGEAPTSTRGLWNSIKAVVPKAEGELYEKLGLEKWLSERPSTTAKELGQWMAENGPKVEVKKLFVGVEETGNSQRRYQLEHELDTLRPGWREETGDERSKSWSPEVTSKFNELDNLAMQADYGGTSDSATLNFTIVNPKPLEQMPGAVDILVRAPATKTNERPLHTGYHFGASDANVIGWARGYEEVLPNGEKVFHVFEVQSDWWQQKRRSDATRQEENLRGRGNTVADHPLLPESNRLALKAAIKHAKEIGAKYIAISDAETAMITQGHNQAAVRQEVGPFKSKQEATLAASEKGRSALDVIRIPDGDPKGEWFYLEGPKQEGGMRLNYDKELPKIAEELTGYKPVRVSFGEHKNAPDVQNDVGFNERPAAFKNPDGTPKTDITARLYPLDKVSRVLAERLGFSFFSKDKITAFLHEMEKEGASPEQLARAGVVLSGATIRKGEDIYDWLARRAGIDPRVNVEGSPQALFETTGRYFDGYFRARGFDVDTANMLTGFAQSLTNRFAKLLPKTRVTKSAENNPNFYVRSRQDRWNDFIALAERNFVGRPQAAETLGQFVALGHEAFHGIEERYGLGTLPMELRVPFENALNAAKQMSADDRVALIQHFTKKLVKGRVEGLYDYRAAKYDDPNIGANEFLADFTGLMVVAQATPEGSITTRDWALFGNQATTGWLKSFGQFMTETMRAVIEWFKRSFGVGQLDSKVRGQMETLVKNLEGVIGQAQKADDARSALQGLMYRASTDIVDYQPTLSRHQIGAFIESVNRYESEDIRPIKHQDVEDAIDELETVIKKPGSFGDRMSWYHYGYPMTQLARRFPQIKAAVDLGMSFAGVASEYIKGTWELHFTNEAGRMDMPRLRALTEEGSRMNRAFSAVGLFQQEEKKMLLGVELQDFLRSHIPGITDKEIADVDKSLIQIGNIHVALARKQLVGYRDDVKGMMVGMLMSHDRTLKASAAQALADKLGDTLINLDNYPVPRAQIAREQLMAEGFDQAAADAMGSLIENGAVAYKSIAHQLLGKDLEGKPWFMSEVRLGDWSVAFMDKSGRRHLEAYKTQRQAEERLKVLNEQLANGQLKYVKGFNKSDRSNYRSYLQTELVNAYKEADSKWYDHALSVIGVKDPDVALEMKELYQPGQGVDRVARSPYRLERNLIAGREKLNMAAGVVHYVDSVAYGLAKRYVKNRQRGILNDPEMRQNEQLKKTAETYLRAITDPEGKEFTALKNFVFFHYMGFNPASILVEPTQAVISHVPLLVSAGDGVGQAFGRLGRAMRSIGTASLGRVLTREGEIRPSAKGLKAGITDENLMDLLHQGTDRRIIESGFVTDMFNLEDQEFVSEKSLMTGTGKVAKGIDVAKNSAYWMAQMARKMYSIAPRFNARVAMVSAYEHAREKGMPHQDAVDFAADATRTSMFGGGVANRPMVLHGLGKAQGAGGLVYSLQSYTANMYGFAMTLVHDSLARSGLDPAQRLQAKKALGVMGAAQFVLGGAMGLPMVSTLLAIWEQVFKGSSLRENIRSAFFKVMNDDEDAGNFLAEAAMGGVVNALVPATDIGSRFQLGGLFGVNPYDGISWKNLFGPVAGLVEAYAKGVQGLANGDSAAAMQMVPAGLRGPAKMLVDQGQIKDPQGRLVLDPTAAEKALMVLGLKPRRLTQYYEKRGMEQRAEERATLDKNDFLSKMADLVMEGRANEVADLLHARQSEMPGRFDVVAATQRIAEIIQTRTNPRAMETTGSREASSQLANIRRLYPTLIPESESQVERYLQTKRTEQAIGTPGSGVLSHSQLRKAMVVDRLLQQNPGMYRQQAEMVAEAMMRPVSQAKRYGLPSTARQ